MTMTLNWNDLEGVSLAGRYWLKQCLTSTADDAWYLIRLDPTRDASVRVMRADTASAQSQLEIWREVVMIDHPNILRMFDAGRTEASGADLLYAVCELPDDFVANALVQRPLSTAEAGDVLRACVDALAFLHDRGLVNGGVDPEHIVAVGDKIKLPCDMISRSGAQTPADDMAALGSTLVELLTRQRPEIAPGAEAPFLPEPFGSIAQHTLRHNSGERWTIEDVVAHLRPRVVEPPPAPVLPPPAPAVVAAVEPEPERVAPVLPPARPPRETPPARRRMPPAWLPLAGALAVAGLSVVFLGRHGDPAAKPTSAAAPAVTAPAALPTSKPVSSPARVAVERPQSTPAVWRVVAYEYAKRPQAEKKAQSINQKDPELKAAVYAPRGNRAPYFVSLGGRLTFSQAEQLRRMARAKGMPRDTFVRNFSD